MKVEKIISEFFVSVDNSSWEKVQSFMADSVLLDYSSFGAGDPATLSPKQITDSWSKVLPGFENTHHQIGNLVVNEKDNLAVVSCYGTTTHFLHDSAGSVWSVYGSYDFELIKQKQDWKISKMKFNFKFQDGNTDLINKAINNIKK